jgi:uncharacterized protein YaaQ
MSTKTTFKRIALVAVAALGFGTMSVAPTTAAVNAASLYFTTQASIDANAYADFSSTSSNILLTGSAVIGLQHSFVASAASDAATVEVKLTQNVSVYPNTNAALPVQTLGARAANNTAANNANTTTAISADGMTMTTTATAAGLALGSLISTFTPTVAGTYIVTFTAKSGGAVDEVFTWTVNAYATQVLLDAANGVDNAISAAKTTSFLNAGETTTVTGAADTVVAASMVLSASAQRATIIVTPKNAADVAITNVTFPITATITGPGTLGIDAAASVASIASVGRAITGTTGHYAIGVFSDGTAGVATITISTGTTVLATETVTFYGDAAKITPTVVNSVLKIGANTGAITAVVTDAAGVAVPNVTVYAVSATAAAVSNSYTSCGASSATGAVTCDLAGVAAGTSEITLTLNSSATGTSTVSAVAGTMRVSDGVPTKVAYTFDKESYAPGQAATITATVSNAEGVMPAGSYTVLATGGVTANYTVSGLPSTAVLAVGSTGAATYAVTIPVGITGDLELTGTAAATTITATFGKAAVVNVALDAAEAATDAATDAYDAALAATDAANDATAAAEAATAAAEDAADAVAALATQVTEMVNALKKQITALTNLVIKIQKKVKA